MKTWQKVQVSPRLWLVMFFGAAMFVIGAVADAVFSWPGKTPCGHEQNVQPQPTPPATDTPKTTAHECVAEPWNPLRAIADRVERGMTRERLERNVKELDDGRLAPAVVRKERFGLTNGTSYGMEYWSWTLETKKAERETWNITLTLDLCEDKVVGIHYTSGYNVAVMSIHK